MVNPTSSGTGAALNGNDTEDATALGQDPGMPPSPQRKPMGKKNIGGEEAPVAQPVPGLVGKRSSKKEKEE
jgi:hypothetical protein